MITQNEQKLVDICFQLTLTMKARSGYLSDTSIEEVASWTAQQLRDCGFCTTPCGSSWGILTDIKDTNGN